MVALVAQQPLFVYAAAAIIGLVAGSFVNVVIVRLPRMMEVQWRMDAAEILELPATEDSPEHANLARPRSACPRCNAPIRAIHNIPLLSYVWLRGRCADCGERISAQYPAVEAVAALMAIAVIARFGLTAFSPMAMILSWMLLALAVIDWRTQFLPDALTLSLLWLGLVISLGHAGGLSLVDPATAVAGAAAGYLVLWLVFQLFLLVTGKEGMGYGDFKLLAALGAWLGWQALPMVLLMASLAGALIGGALMAGGRLARGRPMPFGPWLAIAGWLALVAGDTITRAYVSLAGIS